MTTIARRGVLKCLAAMMAGGVISGLSGCSSPSQKLVVTVGGWHGYEPLFLAKQLGWLDPDRVRLGEVPSNASSMHALATGVAEAAALTLDEVLLLRSQGVPLVIVLVFDISAGADMLLARSGIRSLQDLRGKRVALEQGTYASLMLDKALEATGLERGDVTQLEMAIGDQSLAWKNGEIDAAVTYAPVAGELESTGANRLFDSRQIPDTILDVLAIRAERLVAGRGDVVRHLTATHFKMLEFLERYPDDAAVLIGARRRSAPVSVSSAYEGLILPDLEGNRRLLAGHAPVLLEKARIVADAMQRSGLLARNDDLTGLVNGDYLPG